MTNILPPDNLSPDRPGIEPKDDQLGYAAFAKHLSRCIIKMPVSDGIVLALYGPWGSGKTTVLNFVEHFINEEPQDTRPIIVKFNPWWFSGDEALVRHFFDQLNAALASRVKQVGNDVRKSLANFTEAVAEMPLTKIVGHITKVAGVPISPEEAAKVLAKVLKDKPKDVAALKSEVTAALRKTKHTILVVIDDIDRLTAEEMRQLFRVVKAIADFPNVAYLMAFDKDVAVHALCTTPGISGEQYLEKIVQVPFELPVPDRILLRKLLYDRLDQILVGSEALFDQVHWANVFADGIDPYISTPRNVMRLTNSVAATYPALAGEINPVDFIAMETIRLFMPSIWSLIRQNPSKFAGPADSSSPAAKEIAAFHEAWLSSLVLRDQDRMKSVLRRLFPKLQSVWGNMYYGGLSVALWRKQLRVCASDVFQTYFQLYLPDGTISKSELDSFLANLGDRQATVATLRAQLDYRRPDGSTRAQGFLERLEDYTERDIPHDAIRPFLLALADLGDDLVAADRGVSRSLYDFGVGLQISRLYVQLLRRVTEPELYQLLVEVSSSGSLLTAVTELHSYIDRSDSEEPDPFGGPVLTSEHRTDLLLKMIGLIRASAADGRLLGSYRAPRLLRLWHENGDVDEVRTWFDMIVSSDSDLPILLEQWLGKTRSQAIGDYGSIEQWTMNTTGLDVMTDQDELAARVRHIGSMSMLTDMQRVAVEQYLKAYTISSNHASSLLDHEE